MLKSEISKSYSICIDTVTLISDFCASVYILNASDKKYIFKLYRHFDTEIAIQSINIMCYLSEKSFPVASIVNTKKECPNIVLSFPEGNRLGVLFNYIEGTMGYDLQFDSYAPQMGELLSIMHNVMKTYCEPLLHYGKEHYIGRYINLMKAFNYTPSKIDELEEYGNILWENVAKSKEGFCHGDMNASNFIKSSDNKFYIFDFDCAGFSYPINDLFAICCVSESFPRFNIASFKNPNDKFLLLRQGYEKHRKLDEYDVSAFQNFIGLNCFWMEGQGYKYRSHLEGRQWLNEKYFDDNYEWLMHWKNHCKTFNTR